MDDKWPLVHEDSLHNPNSIQKSTSFFELKSFVYNFKLTDDFPHVHFLPHRLCIHRQLRSY